MPHDSDRLLATPTTRPTLPESSADDMRRLELTRGLVAAAVASTAAASAWWPRRRHHVAVAIGPEPVAVAGMTVPAVPRLAMTIPVSTAALGPLMHREFGDGPGRRLLAFDFRERGTN